MMTNETKTVLRRLGISQREWAQMAPEEQMVLMAQRILRDEQKRQWRSEMPDEPYRRPQDTEEPVIWFQKTFGKESERGEPMPPVYTYVAFKRGPNSWECTRESRTIMSWPELWEFAALRETSAPVIYRATQWEVVE